MINLKSIKWSYGAVVTLALGLSSCYMMDSSNSERVTYSPHHQRAMHAEHERAMEQQNAHHPMAAKKASANAASKAPAQKTGPGPKRAAAPQLPVIQ